MLSVLSGLCCEVTIPEAAGLESLTAVASPTDPVLDDDGDDDGVEFDIPVLLTGAFFAVPPTAPPTTAPITTRMITKIVMVPFRLRQNPVRGFEA